MVFLLKHVSNLKLCLLWGVDWGRKGIKCEKKFLREKEEKRKGKKKKNMKEKGGERKEWASEADCGCVQDHLWLWVNSGPRLRLWARLPMAAQGCEWTRGLVREREGGCLRLRSRSWLRVWPPMISNKATCSCDVGAVGRDFDTDFLMRKEGKFVSPNCGRRKNVQKIVCGRILKFDSPLFYNM